ncbi:MAG: PIN domain-containing protein [Chlorobium sp.]|nr:MAG: hypothetical protein FDX17_08185 [Chlorobium sp.]
MINNKYDYDAFTIDTCIFDNYNIDFGGGLLKQLEQFLNSPVKFIISDIIHNELKSHLTKKIHDARDVISKGLDISLELKLSDQLQNKKANELLIGNGADDVIAENRILNFYANTGAKMVCADSYVCLNDLIKMYFSVKPPFENQSKKKHEFPDAFALLTLESWAKKNKSKILVVTSDQGWKKFAESSLYIDVIENLRTAISHFQPHNAANTIIEELQTAIIRQTANIILDKIEDAIKNSIENTDIFPEASSFYNLEGDTVYATYLSHKYIEQSGKPEINVIRIGDGSLVIQLLVSITCEVSCEFSLYFRDTIDHEDIKISEVIREQEETYLSEVLVSLSGDFSQGLKQVFVSNVEVIETLSTVDFGDIEQNWGDE